MSYNPHNPNGQTISANSSPVVIASDQTAVPVSGTVSVTANSPINQAQIAGTATDVNSGLKSAGTQRVVLATDQPQLTNALKVDGSAVTQPVNGTVTANAGTGTFGVNNSQIGGVSISTGNGTSGTGVQRVTIASDSTGQIALATGANTIGAIGINAGTNTIGAVTLLPAATGGWSANSQTALTNTKVAVKASAGTFGGYMAYNPNAAVAYIQVFDVASASVTLGTTTPTYVIALPPAAAANVEFTLGINHATAITLAATTAPTGAGAPSSALTGFFLFK